MRLISAGSLVRAQSGPIPLQIGFRITLFGICIPATQLQTAASSTLHSFPRPAVRLVEPGGSLELKINKWHLAACRKELQRQKHAHVCWNLNARWLKCETINELITFLRDRKN